jgi:hypothetical protein
MNFLKSKAFFVLIACISILRLFFFAVISSGSEYGNFEPAYTLDNFNPLFSGLEIVRVVAYLLMLSLPILLFLNLAPRFGESLPNKMAIIGLSVNSFLLFIYITGEFYYWWDGFSVGIILWFFVCLTIFIFPLLAWLLLGFTGTESILFLFLTTLIQVGLLIHLILSGKIKKSLATGVNIPVGFNTSLDNSTYVIGKGSKTMKSNTPTWTVRIPGQPENPVDTATLQNWAKSGFVKADTMVTEVATGYAYQAKQIPGVFSSKSYVTTLLLSFFFGVLGVDRFYLGHVGVGLGKLFTFGGLGVWALIDFILVATKNVKDGQGIPLA